LRRRIAVTVLIGLIACAQPHEIDVAARPTIRPDAVVKVWVREGSRELKSVRMTDDSISGIPVTKTPKDTHRVAFALKDVSRVVVTQEPSAGSVVTQAAIIMVVLGGLAWLIHGLSQIGGG
jgi:hypothetical protein